MKTWARGQFLQFGGGLLGLEHVTAKTAAWIRFARWWQHFDAPVFFKSGTSAKKDWASNPYHDRGLLWQMVIDTERLNSMPVRYLEFGVYQGDSLRWWAEHLKCPNALLWGFDCFTGLPDDTDSRQWAKGRFDVGGALPSICDPRVRFQVGLFQKTLPKFLLGWRRTASDRLIVHLDADLYSSTLFVLITLAPHLRAHDILMFDEFSDPQQEFRAWEDFLVAYPSEWKVLGATGDLNRVALQKQ
jgi:O-methyltransferase